MIEIAKDNLHLNQIYLAVLNLQILYSVCSIQSINLSVEKY